MPTYATVQVSPRSIAWLVDTSNWNQLEYVVEYNSGLLGGMFNILIPITNGHINPRWRRFLHDIDPDLIILPPNIDSIENDDNQRQENPFGYIPWKTRFAVVSRDPASRGSGLNVPSEMIYSKSDAVDLPRLVAVSDVQRVDASRFALLACGDLKPRQALPIMMDGDSSSLEYGAREIFLAGLTRTDNNQHVGEAITTWGEILRAPDRFALADIIRPEHQFPLSTAMARIQAVLGLGLASNSSRRSFLGSSVYGLNPGFDSVLNKLQIPNLVLLISDSFDAHQAILFWNLRAMKVNVVWLSFAEAKSELSDLSAWLDSDYGGTYYGTFGSRRSGWGYPPVSIVFSSPQENMNQLEELFNKLQKTRKAQISAWEIMHNAELIIAEYEMPAFHRQQVAMAQDDDGCSFLLDPRAARGTGISVACLKWDRAVLPRCAGTLVTTAQVPTFVPAFVNSGAEPIMLPKMRIDRLHRLRCQIESSSEEPILFRLPRFRAIVNRLLVAAGYSEIAETATAKYQQAFCDRAGGLAAAAAYLRHEKCGALFRLLAGKLIMEESNTWPSVKCPEPRHVMHHYHLLKFLGLPVTGTVISSETVDSYYNKVADEMPLLVMELLRKRLLERGFRLKCENCTYNGWYPAELVGQDFRCQQCGTRQIILSNPLWLYKLPEIIYRGMQEDMDVPLLALDVLRVRSPGTFEYQLDAAMSWEEQGKKKEGNIDFLCSLEGRIFAGEAKKRGDITELQFTLYRNLASKTKFDGLVFATAERQWNCGTLRRIEHLAASWNRGEIIQITQAQLNQPNSTPTG